MKNVRVKYLWTIASSIILILMIIISGILIPVVKGNDVFRSYHIDSEFMLWKDTEKMINSNFTVSLYYYYDNINLNISNSNISYIIRVDNDIRTGNFTHNVKEFFNVSNGYTIRIFDIKINNETLLTANNIYVISGMTGDSIKRSFSQFLISLSPYEWTSKERNVFYAIITASLLSIVISYRGLKRYRKTHGIKIKGD